jgi:hypothetical protein
VSENITDIPDAPVKHKGGRPRGSRSRPKANALMDRLAKAHAPEIKEIFEMTVKLAKAGEPWAAREILSRLWPAPKSRMITFDLTPINSAADGEAAIGAVLAAVASGKISAEEADKIVSIIQAKVETQHARLVEERLAALEAARPAIVTSYKRIA